MTTRKSRYTTRQIQEKFGWATPGQVAQTAKQESAAGYPWGRLVTQDRTVTYQANAVDAYALARHRTPLLRELGWKAAPWKPTDQQSGRGRASNLCRSDEYDIPCPVCGGIAVRYKEKTLCREKDH